MKVLVESIYEGDMGAPYCEIVVIGHKDEEIARITVIEEWEGTAIKMKWGDMQWANVQL